MSPSKVFILLSLLLLCAAPALAAEKKVVITRTNVEGDFYPMGKAITGSVTFRFDGDWKYGDAVLLEAGVFPAGQDIRQGRLYNPLAIGEVQGSRASLCDGHKSWSNIVLGPSSNWDQFREITLTFSLEPPDNKPGRHDVLFGAYTGCGGGIYEQLGTKIYVSDPSTSGTSGSSGGSSSIQHSVDLQSMTINGQTFSVTHPTGNPIVVTGTVVSNTPGRNRYLVECSIVKGDYQPLAFLSAKQSACDGNPHYSGDFYTFNQGEQIRFQFDIQDYGRGPGEETVVCGVYTDCGGKEVVRDRRVIQVTAPPPPPSSGDDSEDSGMAIGGLAKLAGGLAILGLVGAFIGYFVMEEVFVIGLVVFIIGAAIFAQQVWGFHL